MSSNAPTKDLMWVNFFEFSYNNYTEEFTEENRKHFRHPYLGHSPKLRWDQDLWIDLTKQIADAGGNAVMLHLGDGIKYESHPEIAVDDAWSIAELKAEI